MNITTHNLEQRRMLDSFGRSFAARYREVPAAMGHKFKVGDSMCLVGLQDYPEFNGQIVIIVGFREPDPNIGYYIESDNAEVSDQLNFIYENRLEPTNNDTVLPLAVFQVNNRWNFSYTVNGKRREWYRTFERPGRRRQTQARVVREWNNFYGEKGGGPGNCEACDQIDELNFDLLCGGCERLSGA